MVQKMAITSPIPGLLIPPPPPPRVWVGHYGPENGHNFPYPHLLRVIVLHLLRGNLFYPSCFINTLKLPHFGPLHKVSCPRLSLKWLIKQPIFRLAAHRTLLVESGCPPSGLHFVSTFLVPSTFCGSSAVFGVNTRSVFFFFFFVVGHSVANHFPLKVSHVQPSLDFSFWSLYPLESVWVV